MKQIKCNCQDCHYCGMFNPSKQVASCDNEENDERIVIEDCLSKKHRLGVKRTKWDEEVKCEHFVPEIEAEKEFETICNVNHKCPYCGNEDCEYDADIEGSMIIQCPDCYKVYSIRW